MCMTEPCDVSAYERISISLSPAWNRSLPTS